MYDKTISGKNPIRILGLVLDDENKIWGELSKNEWIRLTGFDFEDLGKIKSNIFDEKVPAHLHVIAKLDNNFSYRVLADDIDVLGIEDGNWIRSGQVIHTDEIVAVIEVDQENSGDFYYKIGNNQWIKATGWAFSLLTIPTSNRKISKINLLNKTRTNVLSFKGKQKLSLDPHKSYQVWSSYQENRKTVEQVLGSQVQYQKIAFDAFNMPWVELTSNQWIRLDGNQLNELDQLLDMNKLTEAVKKYTDSNVAKVMSEMIDAIYLAAAGMEQAEAGMEEMASLFPIVNQDANVILYVLKTTNDGMNTMSKALVGINQDVSSMIQALKTANDGMSSMNNALKTVNQTVNGINYGLYIANQGMAIANRGADQMLAGLRKMNDATLQSTKGANEVRTAIGGWKESLYTQLALIQFNNNWTIFDHQPQKNINVGNYLKGLYQSNRSAFQAYYADNTLVKQLKNSMITSKSAIQAISFLVGGTIKIAGGATATITGIEGVTAGFAIVNLASGGTALVATPGVVVAGGALAIGGTAVMVNGIEDLVSGVQLVKFNNGDRPESRTYGNISGKYEGKNVTYRVDAEPKGKKVQIQINGSQFKKFDTRINVSEINSENDVLSAIPKVIRRGLTKGNLEKMIRSVYKAVKSVK